MKISEVIIKRKIEEKIFYKHNITLFEIEEALFNNPYITKTRNGRYVAVNWVYGYITIIFEFDRSRAEIVIAYPSSDPQRKLFKRKKQ